MQGSPRVKDERGAYAILFALLVTSLVVIAAFAVDIGNAVARKSDVQGQADFAALAAGRELGAQANGTIPAAAVNAARDYLNTNSPQNGDCSPGCVTSAQLTDCPAVPVSPYACYTNGEVLWAKNYPAAATPKFCGPSGLCVIAPKEHVDYGLAEVIGINGQDVQASATVGIFSPGRTLPFFVSQACSHLQQTILDPAAPQNPVIPPLTPASDPAETAEIETVLDGSGDNKTPVGVDPGTITVTIRGGANSATGVTKVLFTTAGATPVNVEATITNGPTPIAGGKIIQVTVPITVYNSEALWYVRVVKDQGPSVSVGRYEVGEPPLLCEGHIDGNFGSLRLPRDDTNSTTVAVALNIAVGIQHSLGTMSPPVEPCSGMPGAVLAPDPPNPSVTGINCLLTDTGSVQSATDGFVRGLSGHPGLLDVANGQTSEGCGALTSSGALSNRSISLNGPGGPVTINNDVLTCYFTDPSVTIDQVSQTTGAPSNVISESIFDSPRFFYLPVLSNDPNRGTKSWPIIEFRAAFLTGQPGAASSTDPMLSTTMAAGVENGLVCDNNGVEKVRVVLLNEASMPDNPDTDVLSPFRGSGNRIIRLID